MLSYRGYDAEISFADGDEAIHGSVINIADTIHFQGRSLDELKRSFEDSVDDYLAWCEESGHTPAKPYSGTLLLRMEPELHRRAALCAGPRRLNGFIVSAIERAVASDEPSTAIPVGTRSNATGKRSTTKRPATTKMSASKSKASASAAASAGAGASKGAAPKTRVRSMASKRSAAEVARIDAAE
jgi:predicted HicB family RNase H-like nuclease